MRTTVRVDLRILVLFRIRNATVCYELSVGFTDKPSLAEKDPETDGVQPMEARLADLTMLLKWKIRNVGSRLPNDARERSLKSTPSTTSLIGRYGAASRAAKALDRTQRLTVFSDPGYLQASQTGCVLEPITTSLSQHPAFAQRDPPLRHGSRCPQPGGWVLAILLSSFIATLYFCYSPTASSLKVAVLAVLKYRNTGVSHAPYHLSKEQLLPPNVSRTFLDRTLIL